MAFGPVDDGATQPGLIIDNWYVLPGKFTRTSGQFLSILATAVGK